MQGRFLNRTCWIPAVTDSRFMNSEERSGKTQWCGPEGLEKSNKTFLVSNILVQSFSPVYTMLLW